MKNKLPTETMLRLREMREELEQLSLEFFHYHREDLLPSLLKMQIGVLELSVAMDLDELSS